MNKLIRFLTMLDNLFFFLEKSIVIVLFSALVILITGNIISRNLFGVSSNLILEVSPFIVLWLALAGATIGLKIHRHIKLEIILRFCSPRVRRIAHVCSGVFGMTVMGILVYVSVIFVKNETAIFGFKGLGALIFPAFFSLSLFRYLTGLFSEPEKNVKNGYKLTPTALFHTGQEK